MTWRELKNYISKQSEEFLDSTVKVFDYNDGSEIEADITELLCEERKGDSGWIPYLIINSEVEDGETEETSVY